MRRLSLLVLLALAPSSRAEEAPSPAPVPAAEASAPSPLDALPEGDFPVRVVLAKQDGVPVRAEPGFVYKEVNHLAKGREILVDGRKGPWLRVRPAGWVLAEHVEEPPVVPPPAPRTVLQSLKEGARVRSGPATDQAVVRTLPLGAQVEAEANENGWWKLADGGWVFGELVKEVGRRDPPASAPDAPSALPGREGASPTTAQDFARVNSDVRWSLMDMHGIMFEVSPISPRSPFLAVLKREMKATGILEEDWTYMRLAITVPPGPYRFNYAPDANATIVLDAEGTRYGSVYLRGPVERLPSPIRELFMPATVSQGQAWAGILLFRPTLNPYTVREITMFVGGRLQKLYRTD